MSNYLSDSTTLIKDVEDSKADSIEVRRPFGQTESITVIECFLLGQLAWLIVTS